jgi:hypothetical protein
MGIIEKDRDRSDLSDWSFQANEAVATVEMVIGGRRRSIEIKVAASEPGDLKEVLEAFQKNNYEALEQLANQFLDRDNHSVSVILAAESREVKTGNEEMVRTSNQARKVSTQVLHQEPVDEVRKKTVNRVYQHLMSCLPRSSGLFDKPLTVTLIVGDKAKDPKWHHSESISSSFSSIVSTPKPARPKRAPPPRPDSPAAKKPAMPKRAPPPRPDAPLPAPIPRSPSPPQDESESLIKKEEQPISSDTVTLEEETVREKRVSSTIRRAVASIVKKADETSALLPIKDRKNSGLALNKRATKPSLLSAGDYAKAIINFPLAALTTLFFIPLKLFKAILAPSDLPALPEKLDSRWSPLVEAYNKMIVPVNKLFNWYRESTLMTKVVRPVLNVVVARPYYLVASVAAAGVCLINGALWGLLLVPRALTNGIIRLSGGHPPAKSPFNKAVGDRVNAMIASTGTNLVQAGVVFANLIPVPSWKTNLLEHLLGRTGVGLTADANMRQQKLINKYKVKPVNPKPGAIYSYFTFMTESNRGIIDFYNELKGDIKVKFPEDQG